MDITASKKDLFRLLERCAPVADKKSAMPLLANVLLVADTALAVAATDLYLSMTGSAACEVITAGSVAVPAKDLFERVKAMPDGPIQITSNDVAQVTVKAVGQARRYSLHGLPAADFPPLPKPEGDAIDLPCDTFSLLMARTHFSISVDETRAHVNSALCEIGDGVIRMVSTDGHRLSKMEVKCDARRATMLIPLKAIGELRRLMDAAKGERLTIHQSGPCAFFTVGGFTFSTKLVDQQFPPWKDVLTKPVDGDATIPRLATMEALKAIALAASDRTGGVKLSLVPGALRVTSESPESGNAFDEIPIDYAGAEKVVGCNAKYLLDALGCLDADDVVFHVAGELDPMSIEAAGSADFNGTIMPLRV